MIRRSVIAFRAGGPRRARYRNPNGEPAPPLTARVPLCGTVMTCRTQASPALSESPRATGVVGVGDPT